MNKYTVTVYNDGDKAWYLNGELHRTDGPAVEYCNGDKSWYLHGKRRREEEFLKKTQPKNFQLK